MSFKSLITLLISFTISASILAPAFADSSSTPALDKKEASMDKDTAKAAKSGKLTDKEVAEIKAKEDKLKADEAAAKADGKVTKKEKKALNKEAAQNAKAAKKLKHNDDKDAPETK